MLLRAFWGGVLASVKPISTIKTALLSFDILFYLALVLVVVLFLRLLVLLVVLVLLLLVRVRVLLLALALALFLALVLVLALVLALVLVVVVSLLPCNFSSMGLSGRVAMDTIEEPRKTSSTTCSTELTELAGITITLTLTLLSLSL